MGNVSVVVDGLKLIMKNDFFSATFTDGHATKVLINNQNIIGNLNGKKSFYIDYNDGENISFVPDSLEIVELNEDFSHVVYAQSSASRISIEQHYIITSGMSGIYCYVIARNKTDKNLSIDEFRLVCRFDPDLMPLVHNGEIEMQPKRYSELEKYTKVQDETWQLPDGTYYSKYDLARFVRDKNFCGVLGNNTGAWFIHPNHEYFSGGPLKQDLITHQDSLMIVYMSGAHFGTPKLEMPAGFQKMYGPWVIHFNQGSNSEMINDVINQSSKEAAAWPYHWVDESLYPLSRGSVRGKINGVVSEVVLSPEDEEFDLQVRGYSWHTRTNSDGSFRLDSVRPGRWLLTVYPLSGAAVGALVHKTVIVAANVDTDIGELVIAEPQNVLWQIGETDRRASGYQYSGNQRNYRWKLLPPADLTFTVGKSDPAREWYYAQTQIGSWNVEFEDRADGAGRSLKLGIAAASSASIGGSAPTLHVYLNETLLDTISYPNDKSIYRGATLCGNYHLETWVIPAALVKDGKNTLKLTLSGGAFMYDSLVYLLNT